jgi:hypothetical protein
MRNISGAVIPALKVVAAVALLGFLSADFGLRTAIVLFCNDNSYGWCAKAVTEQQKLSEWAFGKVFDTRLTDILVALFTYFLVRVGRGQQRIMSAQAAIAEQQTEILKRQSCLRGHSWDTTSTVSRSKPMTMTRPNL